MASDKVALFNIIILGLCFMVLFSAELAGVNIQKTIISSIHEENGDFQVEGYFLHGVSYTVYAISLWLAPAIVYFTGPRLGMCLSILGYLYYLLAFTIEKLWAVYTSAVVIGISGAVLWTSQNKYLLSNSHPQTQARNINIFWFFYSSSKLHGNLLLYFHLEGKKFIDRETRCSLMYTLSSVLGVGLVMLLLLRPGVMVTNDKNNMITNSIKEFRSTWNIFLTREFSILCITFLYVGLQQVFTFGVYSSGLGFTLRFGNNAKQLVALSGMFIAAGEMICGGLQVLLNKWLRKYSCSRLGILMCGQSLQLVSVACIYINLPDSAVFGNTYEPSYIENSMELAMVCSLLLGLADCCLNTQVYTLLAALYPDCGAQTCAIYKFSKAIVKAISFYSCNHLGLHTHIYILLPTSILGVYAYSVVDRSISSDVRASQTELQELRHCENEQPV